MQASLLLLIGQTNYTLRMSLERTCHSNCAYVVVDCVCVRACACVCACVHACVCASLFISLFGADAVKSAGDWRRDLVGWAGGRELGWGGAVQVVRTDGNGGDRGGGVRQGQHKWWVSFDFGPKMRSISKEGKNERKLKTYLLCWNLLKCWNCQEVRICKYTAHPFWLVIKSV